MLSLYVLGFSELKTLNILHLCLARAVLVKILVDKDVGYKTIKVSSSFLVYLVNQAKSYK